jgi:hypothetical protein
MTTVQRAESMTENERRFMGVPPWLILGPCYHCGKRAVMRTYGVRAELTKTEILCKDCRSGT